MGKTIFAVFVDSRSVCLLARCTGHEPPNNTVMNCVAGGGGGYDYFFSAHAVLYAQETPLQQSWPARGFANAGHVFC